ncbi:alpha/beta hydrolase [Sinomicrobium weinanense]|uniref:Alpha/beta hydrolase n=1 Tax=Sinomicrobium weinanense TaxID=2842200 RepID=A0A926JUU6_9FLAO|nr:alpha/beta hydrolase [Sinomicrobium weinanense]MBC9797643.1 alpha/beta hydrolase [Sinomicrobium weinanense]MBU3122675.1 alpha/beta hydrolase [Sinomicrobium weinanense]
MKNTDPVDIKIESRIKGKSINLSHLRPERKKLGEAVLFIHGASFPSELAFGFRMNEISWMDNLADAGYEVYALDFLGYGKSDRYDYMSGKNAENESIGRGEEVVKDMDIAINYILTELSVSKINLIGHSWGAAVSGHYASLFPEKIDKLVLFAPFIQRNGTTKWDKTKVSYKDLTPGERVEQFISRIPEGREMTLESEVLDKWGDKWLDSDPTSKTRNPFSVRFPSAWEADLFDCWNGNCFFDPRKIKNPTLLIRGEWDTTFNFDDAEKLFGQMENAPSKRYVVIDRGTHVLHLEKNRFALYDEVQLFFESK